MSSGDFYDSILTIERGKHKGGKMFGFETLFPFSLFDDSIFDQKSNVVELNDKYILYIDVPGFSQEDLNISVTQLDQNYSKLSVIGNIEKENEYGHQSKKIKQEKYLYKINPDKISATVKNGQLTIVIEKSNIVATLPSKEIKIAGELPEKK